MRIGDTVPNNPSLYWITTAIIPPPAPLTRSLPGYIEPPPRIYLILVLQNGLRIKTKKNGAHPPP